MGINNGAVKRKLLADFTSESSLEYYEDGRHFAVFSKSQYKVMEIIK
jgi:phospholipid N-methyltransferase